MDLEILKEYEFPEKVWAIRRISDKKLMAHGYWSAAVNTFDNIYAQSGEYYLEPLKKAPEGAS